MHEIVVPDNSPHVLGISEAILKRSHSLENIHLQDYDLLTSYTIYNDQLQVSRVVC